MRSSTTLPAITDDNTTHADFDRGLALAGLTKLAKLLQESDPTAVDFLERNAAALRPCFPGKGWTQFEANIRAYSFAEALEQLTKATQQLAAEGA